MPCRIVLPVLAVALLVATTAMAQDLRPTDHVVVVSIDGLRPEFYRDSHWPAPMIQQMALEGTSARQVTSIFPSVTYPAHTTILTGVRPAHHGISYNSPFEPDGQTGRWYWEEASIRVATLWDAIRTAGLESASVFWPVSVGAPVDHLVPEIWPIDWQQEDFTGPMRRLSSPPGLVEELELEATGRLTPYNFSFGRISLDDKTAEMAAYLLATYQPNLLTVHLIATDLVQHDTGRDSPMLPRALAAVDRGIARMVEAAEQAGILDRTTFLIVGDHGFIDLHTKVSPNVWLVEAGLMQPRADRGSWRATVHNTSAAGFVFLADPTDQPALEEVREILDSQPEEIRRLYTVLDRAALDELETAPDAALGIAPAPGVYISSDYEPPAIRPSDGASHGFLPGYPEIQTGFIAWGSGIATGVELPELQLTQIAPIIATLLDLELPTATAPVPVAILAPDQSGTTPP